MRKVGGKFHRKLNISSSPIANKYHEGKVKSTLKRELNVPEIVVNQAIGINVVKELGRKLFHPALTSFRSGWFGAVCCSGSLEDNRNCWVSCLHRLLQRLRTEPLEVTTFPVLVHIYGSRLISDSVIWCRTFRPICG